MDSNAHYRAFEFSDLVILLVPPAYRRQVKCEAYLTKDYGFKCSFRAFKFPEHFLKNKKNKD